MTGGGDSATNGGGSRPRVLVLGPLRPPHISDQVVALAERGFPLHVAGDIPPDHSDTVIERAGIPLSVMPDFRRSSPRGMASMVGWVRGLVRSFEPDVVQAHWLPGYGLAAALAGATPLALTAWGSDVYRAGRMHRLANRYALRRAQLVMADSGDLLDRCRALSSKAGRWEVVQWGVDLQLFRPADADRKARLRDELGLGPGPVILSPRSMFPVYNIDTIVAAFERIGSEIPDAQLVLKHMGDATIQLDEIPHRDRVTIIDRVPYERMAAYYAAADLCLSVASSDSSPRSVWEAMASGCPCVLTDLPWVDELIRQADAAELVAVRDVDGLADTVGELLASPERRDQIAANGRGLVERELDREAQMDALAGLLEGVCA